MCANIESLQKQVTQKDEALTHMGKGIQPGLPGRPKHKITLVNMSREEFIRRRINARQNMLAYLRSPAGISAEYLLDEYGLSMDTIILSEPELLLWEATLTEIRDERRNKKQEIILKNSDIVDENYSKNNAISKCKSRLCPKTGMYYNTAYLIEKYKPDTNIRHVRHRIINIIHGLERTYQSANIPLDVIEASIEMYLGRKKLRNKIEKKI